MLLGLTSLKTTPQPGQCQKCGHRFEAERQSYHSMSVMRAVLKWAHRPQTPSLRSKQRKHVSNLESQIERDRTFMQPKASSGMDPITGHTDARIQAWSNGLTIYPASRKRDRRKSKNKKATHEDHLKVAITVIWLGNRMVQAPQPKRQTSGEDQPARMACQRATCARTCAGAVPP